MEALKKRLIDQKEREKAAYQKHLKSGGWKLNAPAGLPEDWKREKRQ